MTCPAVWLAISLIHATFAAEKIQPREPRRLEDPRKLMAFMYSNGEKVEEQLWDCFVIIVWRHPPHGSEKSGYQIWGDSRMLTKAELERSLHALCEITEKWSNNPGLFVVGNEWGAGAELNDTMKTLSGEYELRTYHSNPWPFRRVNFRNEGEQRVAAVKAAIDRGKGQK